MADYPNINGREYSHASITVKAKGQKVYAKEVNYNDSLEPAEKRANAPQALGRTLGEYKADGSLTLFKAEADQLIALLGTGFMAVSFDIEVEYREEGMPFTKDLLRGCRIKKKGAKSSGNDPNEVSFDLHIMYILHNGIAPIPDLKVG